MRICAVAVVGLVAIFTLGACGGDDNDSGTEQGGTDAVATTEGGLPPDAPITRVLAEQFPKPTPTEGAPPGAEKYIEEGRKACKGKTPEQVRDEFIETAAGLNEGQEAMLDELDKFEKQAQHSPDFAAGQLAAGVYEATLPEKEARSGYQGCVYELAVQLRRELASGK